MDSPHYRQGNRIYNDGEPGAADVDDLASAQKESAYIQGPSAGEPGQNKNHELVFNLHADHVTKTYHIHVVLLQVVPKHFRHG